jgi:iron complex transport system permease protein
MTSSTGISPGLDGVGTRRAHLGLTALLLLSVVLSLFVGRYPSAPWTPPATLRDDVLARRLVFNLRLPRVLTACLMGMVLATAGFVLQMLFRNPLVEPGFLGVSQGAAFGAAVAIVILGASALTLQVVATAFGLLGLVISTTLARRVRYGGWTLRLILAGIAVSAFFSAGLSLLKIAADPLSELPELVFWLLGALWGVSWSEALAVLPIGAIALLIAYLMRWRLNVLALDDRTAVSLGTAPARERMLLLIAVVAATAAMVSISGIVGWVGLIVPQIARRLFGADARRALPGSMLLGGLFTLLCDDLARTALAGELPLGIVTSLIGAVAFLVLMIVPPRQHRTLALSTSPPEREGL